MNSQKWMQLDPIPRGVGTDIVLKLNEQQFIFSADTHRAKWNGVYTYDLHLQEFQQFVSFPDFLGKYVYCLELSSSRNRLYGISYKAPMFIIDLNEGKVIEREQLKSQRNHFKEQDQFHGNLLSVNDNIHWIGGYHHDIHLIWNSETREFSSLPAACSPQRMTLDVVVHIPSKRVIIMIAGNIIFKYCLDTIKWQKIKSLPFRHLYESAVLTSDEKYILITTPDSSYIHALDADDFQLYTSSIKGQMEPHSMIISGGMRDDILVVGWIKSEFKTTAFQDIDLPPKYLITLIAKWYSQEELHWINRCNNLHFTINIKHILRSLNKYQEVQIST